MDTLVRPTPEDVRDAGDRGLAQSYVARAKARDARLGVSRNWNDEDMRLAYIAGRREEREDPR